MGIGGGVMISRAKSEEEKSMVTIGSTQGRDAFDNVLRRSIVTGIQLRFQRPTVIIIYGPPYGILENVASFLSEKTNFPVVDGAFDHFKERICIPDCHDGYILVNYPRTFEEAINLPSYASKMERVAIFLTGSYEKIMKKAKYVWTHPPSGRWYHVLDKPPKSLSGKPSPENMLDDETKDQLYPLVKGDNCQEVIESLRVYEEMRREMWSHFLSFRHRVFTNKDLHEIQTDLTSLICGVIAQQRSTVKRVLSSNGIVSIKHISGGTGRKTSDSGNSSDPSASNSLTH